MFWSKILNWNQRLFTSFKKLFPYHHNTLFLFIKVALLIHLIIYLLVDFNDLLIDCYPPDTFGGTIRPTRSGSTVPGETTKSRHHSNKGMASLLYNRNRQCEPIKKGNNTNFIWLIQKSKLLVNLFFLLYVLMLCFIQEWQVLLIWVVKYDGCQIN